MGTSQVEKCDVIMALDKKSSVTYLKNTNKFGSECPKTVENTLTLDKQESNTMLADALPNEWRMKNVQVTFDIIKDSP